MKLFLLLSFVVCSSLTFAARPYIPEEGFWNVTHKPSAATQATITKASVAGYRHTVFCVEATIATGATAQTPIFVDLKKGSTVVKSWAVSAPANGQGGIALCDLKFVAGAGEAVTLEFSAAGVADSRQAVNLTGTTP